ncbi:lactate racemase domain-containing protein [Anaerotruncus rubiinfantis]|uniref:lactate racemase domain-containing protein n=1 Tax=Anaerotruncus rubiinfantis TaxID=1720200 RepID=UPI0011C8EAC8|nr:lactate racemase domain-containing protein [Anaerotruncus rubiinfantis]
MAILPQSVYALKLPKMYRVKQQFDDQQLVDIEGAVAAELAKPTVRALVKSGMRVALLVGSRGICHMDRITRAVGENLKKMGAQPFIIPAMGSHGGGTAEGQRKVLAGYGITEETMGMPVVSQMQVDEIGMTPSGIPICIDRVAHAADLIVPLGRVKPHTDFKGPIESGLCKMLTIGLGKHEGCSRLHQYGFESFAELIPEAARVVIENAPVGFGLAILENGYDKTCLLEAVPAREIHTREPELLKIAKAQMPSIMLKEIDVLVIEQIGKDISGAGMDPNIVGRTTKGPIKGFAGPKIKRIVIEGISPASHGNACGVGLADYVLKACARQIDLPSTYTNSIGSGNPEAGRIPIQVEDEREGILASLRTAIGVDYDALKIVKIRDTLSLGEIAVSQGLLPEVSQNGRMTMLEEINERE